MKTCVLGIDVGTTCTKALVVDGAGKTLGIGSAGYRLLTASDRVEQKAEDWLTAVARAVRQAMEGVEGRVEAISLSTQAGSTVAVGKGGEVLGPAWTWMDLRCAPDVPAAEARLGGDAIYHATGWKLNPSLDLLKLPRMKAEYPQAVKFFTTLEVVNDYLTGRPVIDPTNAAMRQLYGIESGDWEDWLLADCGVQRGELPEIVPTGEALGPLLPAAAAQMGLPAGIPVFNGAHDQYCASLGAGAVRDGDLLLSAGTTWVLMGISRKPLFTVSAIAPGRHPIPGLYGAIASLTASGAAMQWFKDQFLPDDSFDVINREARVRRERTRDLFFYPYQAGANYPLWVTAARGAFCGLTLEHDRFDCARAVMEGAAFGVRRAVEDFRRNGCEIHNVLMMGGAAKSDLWARMIADAADVSLLLPEQADVCALGAAMIAAKGVGWYGDYVEAARALGTTGRPVRPDREAVAFYADKFARFDRMWRSLAGFYADAMSNPHGDKHNPDRIAQG